MQSFRVLLFSPVVCFIAACGSSVAPVQESRTNVTENDVTESKNGDPRKSGGVPATVRTIEKSAVSPGNGGEWFRLYRERMKNPVKLGEIPRIVLKESPLIDERLTKRIRTLIGALAGIDRPDYGFSSTMSGHAFLPVSGQTESEAFLIANHGLESSSALKELVSLGPSALPLLLDSLDDQTPTKIQLEHHSAMGSMWFAQELGGNPLNPLEAKTPEANEPDQDGVTRQERYVNDFTVKVGDLCFVAIGQIVGRSYQAVRYQPTACIVINSPTHDPELAFKIRKIWRSETPHEFLFQSLLRDYSSIGIHVDGDSLDVWDVGNRFQCDAALRLLYYYPAEVNELIAERLRGLDIRETHTAGIDRYIEREVKNGVRTKDFVHAVSWSQASAVRAAVTELFLKTTDQEILLAALPGVDDPEGHIIPRRLQPLLADLPADEGPIYGRAWEVLCAWTKASPESAKKAMMDYIQNGEMQRLQSACAVLRDTSPGWKVEFLRPLLDDKRDLKSWTRSETREVNGQQIKIRLCDMAAHVLAESDKTLEFKLEGPSEQVDAQIDAIRRALDLRQK